MKLLYHLDRLLQTWRARRAGRADGVRLIPDNEADEAPPSLWYLHSWGEAWARRLVVRHWKRMDLKLMIRYWRKAVIYGQAVEAFELARFVAAEAREEFAALWWDPPLDQARAGKARRGYWAQPAGTGFPIGG